MKILPWILLTIGFLLYGFLGRSGPEGVKNELIQLVGSTFMMVSSFMIFKQIREKQGSK
mgnify:FL=1